jgi:NAD(P)-dependent dehydrogenase (short-subunit alcohol dehydrogenase family)
VQRIGTIIIPLEDLLGLLYRRRVDADTREKAMSKVWFITGAGSGIGAGAARAALKAGDRVVATGRNVQKVRNALSDVASENLEILPLDVTDEAQATTAVDQAVKRFGRLDVLLNSAGYSLLGNFEELATKEIERQLATNLWGVIYVMRAALPFLRKQRSGHVINVSSVAGVVGFMHCGAYGASKFAVEGLSLAVAEEVERFGVKVTIVEPGFFRTDLLAPANAKWPSRRIDDYASAEKPAQEIWSPYAGTQQGDPDKLGEVLVKLTGMQAPPRVFVAGGDAIAAIAPAVEARLKAVHALEDLSKSTNFTGWRTS